MKETFGVKHTVSNLQKNSDPARIKYLVRDKMIKELSNHIVDVTLKEVVEDFSTTYECRVIVADVDDFWRLVQKEAMEIQNRFSVPAWVSTNEEPKSS